MLINLRNAMMAGKRLPYDAEVEYLQSSGTQYINTLVNADSNLSVEITMANAGTPWTNTNPMGAILATPRCRHHLNFNNGGSNNGINYFLGNGNNCFASSGRRTTDGEIFTFKVDAISKTFTLGSYLGTFPNDTFDTGLSYWLFGRNGTTPPYLGALRIYSAKLWNNSTLVRDYIPVRKGTVGYLYDRVSGKLFGNAGTGDFVLGQDVVPVEYIESHGTEYIDTGVYPTNNATTIVDAQLTRVSVPGATCHIHIVDSKESWNSRARTIGYWSGGAGSTSRIAVAYGSAGPTPASYAVATNYTTARMIYKIARNVFSVGSIYTHTFATETFTSQLSMKILANAAVSVSATAAKLYGWQHYEGDVLLQDCIPVRVGTEGAMIDVLTRRIYRNAGTGAFTYGNDLKYPIPAS